MSYIKKGAFCPNCEDYYVGVPKIESFLEYEFRTVRIVEALDKILDNLDRIPIEELEKLGDKYGL